VSNLEMWNLVAGFLLPPVIAIIQQPKWPNGLRAVVTFVISLGLAVVTMLIKNNGHWVWHNWITGALTVLVAAIATYHGLWKPTGAAPAIENGTSLGGTTP
jgi:hypothetical protein